MVVKIALSPLAASQLSGVANQVLAAGRLPTTGTAKMSLEGTEARSEPAKPLFDLFPNGWWGSRVKV